jgi:hypothetical protein
MDEKLTKQVQAIRNAYADLQSLMWRPKNFQCKSLEELEEAFPFLTESEVMIDVTETLQTAHTETTDILQGFLQDFSMLANDEYDGPCESWTDSVERVNDLAAILGVNLDSSLTNLDS